MEYYQHQNTEEWQKANNASSTKRHLHRAGAGEPSKVRGGWQRARGGRRGTYGGGRGGTPKKVNLTSRWDNGEGRGEDNKDEFYCCACERGFKLKEQFVAHNEEHTVCGLDGCLFEAHALVVTKHIRMQHSGDLFERMRNLNTPEQVNKWREDRKKNFPTLANVEKKENGLKEKVERGEVCGTNRRRKQDAQSTTPVFKYRIQDGEPEQIYLAQCAQFMRYTEEWQGDEWTNYPFAPDPNTPHIKVPLFSTNQSKIVNLESFYLDVKRQKTAVNVEKLERLTRVKWKGFLATKLDRLEDSEAEEEEAALPISDDEWDQQHSHRSSATSLDGNELAAKSSNNALASFMLVDYSSASDEENEDHDKPTEALPTSNINLTAKLPPSTPAGTTTAEMTTNAQSATSTEEDVMEIKKVTRKRPALERRVGSGDCDFHEDNRANKLLETLLHDQIRKERNTILQVCRFLRDNDFFDKK